MITRKNKRNARIGTFAVAHAKYWEQFDGLYENLMEFHLIFSMTRATLIDVTFWVFTAGKATVRHP